MPKVWAFVIRVLAFLRKENVEILRQPRFVALLILGPFLILLLFGIGFSNEAQPLRTLFVVSEGSPMRQEIEQYATTLGAQLVYAGITGSEAEARSLLQRGNIDVYVLVPENAYQTIRGGERATFTLYHHEIDPFQSDYILAFGQIYVDEVNRRVLREATVTEVRDAAALQQETRDARESAGALRQAIQDRDTLGAIRHAGDLERRLGSLEKSLQANAQVLVVLQALSSDGTNASEDDPLSIVLELSETSRSLTEPGITDSQTALERVAKIETDLGRLETSLSRFENVNPDVVVSPFASETRSVAPVELTLTGFYAPAVIVLLLQHLCVTIAGLSIVRERRTGTMELFHVSPLVSLEILLGKYLSYILFSAVLAVVLTALVVYILGVPMLGRWTDYAWALGVLILASLSIGFVISLLSETTSQVVQYAMIVLLASVFFTGFFQSLELLRPSMRIISLILPATYGIRSLQTVMLRGEPISLVWLAGPIIMTVVFGLAAWLMLRHMLAPR
ncbi:MAG: ABC transporter permease [Anaerolineae bacterium]